MSHQFLNRMIPAGRVITDQLVFCQPFQKFIKELLEYKWTIILLQYYLTYCPALGNSTQHALFRAIESWKRCLDSKGIVGTILMDLSKAYDCIPHDLLIAKLEAYGLDTCALKLMYLMYFTLAMCFLPILIAILSGIRFLEE